MDREVIEIQLTPEERALIFRYGYPFERVEHALQACDEGKIEVVPLDAFELERLVGDLSNSINDLVGSPLLSPLIDLCERLEFALRTGDGMLFEL